MSAAEGRAELDGVLTRLEEIRAYVPLQVRVPVRPEGWKTTGIESANTLPMMVALPSLGSSPFIAPSA